MTELPRRPAILDIVEEHFGELEFLWELREGYLFSHEWTLRDLNETEGRIEAQLDGLRIGAGHSVDIARPAMVSDDPGLATAATFVMMAFGDADLEREVAQALAHGPPPVRDGVRAALRHCDLGGIGPAVAQLAEPSVPAGVRAAALDILAFHRLATPANFDALLRDPDLDVRRLAWEAAGRLGASWAPDVLWAALESDSPALRTAALQAAARRGDPRLAELCRRAATRDGAPITEALAMLGVLGDARDLVLLESQVSRTGPEAPAAIVGIGALGSIAVIPRLLDQMGDELLARPAARAFVRITGATDIEGPMPPPAPIDLEDESIDDSDGSPPPDPAKARAWWDRERERFSGRGRWQGGHEISREPLGKHFDALPLESRRDVYLGARAANPARIPDLELERSGLGALSARRAGT